MSARPVGWWRGHRGANPSALTAVRLGVATERCLAVEDSEPGTQPPTIEQKRVMDAVEAKASKRLLAAPNPKENMDAPAYSRRPRPVSSVN